MSSSACYCWAQTDALPGGDGAARNARVQRASSAVNLARVGRDAELRRLQDDFRVLKEAAREQESQLEELRSAEAESRATAAQCRAELEAQRQHVQRHLTQVHNCSRSLLRAYARQQSSSLSHVAVTRADRAMQLSKLTT